MKFTPADWDRSTALNAPGQSGWADSPHFADQVKLWSEGKPFPLAFSDQAVQAHAEATLTLTPR
jgi:penicillin amidase